MRFKQRVSFLSLFIASALLAISTPHIASASLVGYWPLDDDLLDYSSYGNDGSLINIDNNDSGSTTGGPEFDTDVPAAIGGGKSARFDGIDDGIDLGNNGGASGAYNFTTNDWTISGWIKKASGSDWVIFANGANSGGGIRTNLWRESSSAGNAQLTVDDDGAVGGKVEAVGGTIDADVWHHVAGVRKGNDIFLYVDGALADSDTLPAGYDLSGITQENAYIGTNWAYVVPGLQHFTAGYVDDVAVFDAALTKEQIGLLASGDATPFNVPEPCSSLLLGLAAMALVLSRNSLKF